MKNQEKKLRRGNALLTIAIILLIPVLAFSLMALFHSQNNPDSDSLLGIRLLSVKSQSMEPGIKKDAYVLVYAAPFEDIVKGDIVTFREPDGQFNTHRVIDSKDGILITQGDNSLQPDERGVTPSNYCYRLLLTLNFTASMRGENGFAWSLTHLVLPALGIIALAALITVLLRKKQEARSRRQEAIQQPGRRIEDAGQSYDLTPHSSFLNPDLPPASSLLTPEPDWRTSIFDSLDFSAVDLSDPQIQAIDLNKWLYS